MISEDYSGDSRSSCGLSTVNSPGCFRCEDSVSGCGLQMSDDFFLAGSVLLTPPESVKTVDSPGSPSRCESIVSGNGIYHFFDGVLTNSESDESGSESGSDEDVNFESCQSRLSYAPEQIQDLVDLHKSIIKLVYGFWQNFEDAIYSVAELTNIEYDVAEQYRRLKKQLVELNLLERRLVAAERERIKKKTQLAKDEGGAIETLVHLRMSHPILDNVPITSKFPVCRIGYRLDLSPKIQFHFQSAVLTSVVKQKLDRTAARFDVLALEAGVTYAQLQVLREFRYDQSHMDEFVALIPVRNPYKSVQPVVQTWYSTEGKLRAVARTIMTVPQLCMWKLDEDRKAKLKTLQDVFADPHSKIDWMHVSKILHSTIRFHMEPEECEMLWNNVLNPANDGFIWSKDSLLTLKEIVNHCDDRDWKAVANKMGRGISQFMCFFIYMNFIQHVRVELDYDWSVEEKRFVVDEMTNGGNYGTALVALNNYFPDKYYNRVATMKCYRSTLKYRKSKTDPISPIEDAVLLVTLEKMAELLTSPQIPLQDLLPFGQLLPWRSNRSWTHRLRFLFDEWSQPWTVQDELKLLFLANEFSCQWHLIAKEFEGVVERYRTPPILRAHHKKLTSIFATSSYMEYRKEYEERRKSCAQYLALRRAYEALHRLHNTVKRTENREFQGLSVEHPPNDVTLTEYLLTECSSWTELLLRRMNKFLCDEVGDLSPGLSINTYDRRTFHREDPMSVASALHIRGFKSKPLKETNQLSQFEKLVVLHLENFYKRTGAKCNAARTYLPTSSQLRSLPELSRILFRPICKPLDMISEHSSTITPNSYNHTEFISQPETEVCRSKCSNDGIVDKAHITRNIESFSEDTNIEFGSVKIPKLRETKGKKKSRLSHIRRLTAQRRWQNRKDKAQVSSSSLEVAVENAPNVSTSPTSKLFVEFHTPPLSPLHETNTNIFSPPCPAEKSKRLRKSPARYMFS